MKKFYFFYLLLFTCFLPISAQTTVKISAQGFTFSPDTVSIHVGDTVVFDVGPSHTVLQVSKSTWDANGITPLEGGFSFPSGEGKIALTIPGIYYYVCTIHVSLGMKGQIQVAQLTDIQENKYGDSDFSVFPNPVKGNVLHINFTSKDAGSYIFRLIDGSGRIITEPRNILTVEGMNTIDIPIDKSLSQGIYIMEIDGKGYLRFAKIIK